MPYLPHLAAGCLLALALHASREPPWLRRYRTLPTRSLIIAALCVAAVVVAWLRGRDLQDLRWTPLYALLVPLCALLLIAEVVWPDGRLRRLLSAPSLRWLGRISYSLYLWQQLFFGPDDAYLHPWLWSSWPFNLFAAIGCGALGYYLVEKPSARLKRHFERRADGPSARGEPSRFGRDPMSCPSSANARPGGIPLRRGMP